MRSAKEMGSKQLQFILKQIVFHLVKYADEAVCVGPPASSESYLVGEKIIQICKDLNVDGIHPGYGFLSENAAFAGDNGCRHYINRPFARSAWK